MGFIHPLLIFVLLMASLSGLGPVAVAATKAKASSCENGECIPKMVSRLEELGKAYKAQCLPANIKHTDIEKYHQEHPLSENCWKMITEVDHLESELQKHQSRLETRLGCESGDCKLPNSSNSLNAQLSNLEKVEDQLSCTPAKKQKINNQCSSDMTCVMVSSALGVGGYLAELLVPAKAKPKNCHMGNDSCTTQLVTGFLKSVVTLFKGAWDLLKIAGRAAGKKMTQFWNWVSGAEKHSSTSQLALAKASQDPSIFKEIVTDFPGAMKKIWSAFVASMKEWMKTKVFCQKWSGVPQFSTCLQPTDDFDCLPCKTMVTGLCSITGTILSEVVPAFLTGGLSIAVKQGVNGAAKIARLYKVSQKALKVVAESRAGKIALSAASKADDVVKVSRVVKASKIAVDAALAAIKAYMLSPARKALKVSYTALINASKKGKAYLVVTPVGKSIVFTGKAVKKTAQVILYPIDNQATAFAYNAGARTFERAFRLGQPTLAAPTAVTSAIVQRQPAVESILAKIEEAKVASKVDEKKLLGLESELLRNVEPIRADALKSAIANGDIDLNDIIRRLYPELQYGDLAKITGKEKVLAAERELYLELSKLPEGTRKADVLRRYEAYVAQGERRAQVVGEAQTPFYKEPRPLEREEALSHYNKPLTPDESQLKSSIREYMNDQYDEMLAKASQTEKVIRSSKEPVVYDAIAVGAGPNNGVAVAAMKELNPELNILVIESTENLGTFHRVKAFDINSAEWVGNSGNNFPTSSVQLRDFNVNQSAYATAEELGYVTQANYQIADVDMIFNNTLTKVSKEPTPGAWPAKYKIETDKGNVIYTNAGLITPGLGYPVTRLKDAPSVGLVSRYQAEAKSISLAQDTKYVPRFQDVEEFLTNASKDRKLGRNAMARYQGKKTLLVGDGDGGSIGAEALTGLNQQLNPNGLKTDVSVVWIGQGAKSGEEFVSKLSRAKQPRYGRIGEAIDDGRIQPVNGYLKRIEEFKTPEGETKFKAFYTTKTGEEIAEPVIVDNVVFATGYTHSHGTVTPFFESMAKKQEDIVFNPLMGKVNDYTLYEKMKTVRPSEINKQLVVNGEKEDFYLLGVGAKTPISKRKMKTVTGGFIDITSPRAAATGQHIVQKLAPQKLTRPEMERLLTPKPGETLEIFKLPQRLDGKVKPLPNTAVADIHTKIELGKSLHSFKSAPQANFSVEIISSDKGYKFMVKGLEKKAADQIVETLSNNRRLVHGLDEQMRLGKTKIVVDVSSRESGVIKVEDIRMRSEPVVGEAYYEQPLNLSGGATKLMTPTFKTAGQSENARREKEAQKNKQK